MEPPSTSSSANVTGSLSQLSRREFLVLSGLSVAALAVNPFINRFSEGNPDQPITLGMKARVTTHAIYLYQQPDFKSKRIKTLPRDTLVEIQEEVHSPSPYSHNSRWYRLDDGFINSTYTQRVDDAHLNLPHKTIPEQGQLGEITVPYIQSMRKKRNGNWDPLYWLYFGSIHWITGVEMGPDSRLWYGLTDELLHVHYYVPATMVRLILPEELSPISPEIPASSKRIQVSLGDQMLSAYEGKDRVLHTKISSGIHTKNLKAGDLPTDTPTGNFHIQVKVPSKHMGDGRLTSDPDAYELLGVPWVSFFQKDGIALHGTFWHDNFGTRMSHGCINMRNEDAKWIYRWSLPTASPSDWNRKGYGTLIQVNES